MPPADVETGQPSGAAIGDWMFFPGANELARGGERRRLEDRAARTLEVLERRRGALVSKEELIAAVWNGRTLSDHTVAVVISDLRKALDDDVRSPRYIETVAKRGYRLIANGASSAAPSASGPLRVMIGNKVWLLAIAAIVAGAVALAAYIAPRQALTDATIVTVNNIRNETGEARYDSVAAAANEFSADFVASADNSLLIRDFFNDSSWNPRRFSERQFGRKARVFHLHGRVVLDGREPFLALSLADGRDWSTVWSATLPVSEEGLAAPLRAALGEMLAEIDPAPDGAAAAAPH